MRIALIILHADAARGGAERYTLDLAAALAASGQDVSLLATSFAPSVPVGVRSVLMAAEGLTRTRRYMHFLDSVDQHLAGEKYDIVHAMLPVRRCDLYHPHAGLAVRSIEEARGWKRIDNAMNPRRSAFAEVESNLLCGNNPPMLLCLSRRMQQNVIADGACVADRAVVLFNAVDLRRFDPVAHPHQPGDGLRALIVAQDFGRKGVRPAIEAIARSSGWRLTVVGRDDAGPYQRLAETLGIRDRITFTGGLDDVRPMYQQADVFLLPTSHDPCSLVVLEALAMGVPVISTVANGACEIMTDGTHGFVLDDPQDVEGIARSLAILGDSTARERMRRACLQLRPRLSFETHVRELLVIAGGVVERKTRI